jgi:hypothetical protein
MRAPNFDFDCCGRYFKIGEQLRDTPCDNKGWFNVSHEGHERSTALTDATNNKTQSTKRMRAEVKFCASSVSPNPSKSSATTAKLAKAAKTVKPSKRKAKAVTNEEVFAMLEKHNKQAKATRRRSMETAAPYQQPTKKTRRKSDSEKRAGSEVRDLEELINKHNKSLPASKITYEPRRYSIKDYKLWEKKTGKMYAKLDAKGREAANVEISAVLKQ